MKDVLVSAAAAELPNFIEGMTMQTSEGQTLRIYSSIQAALDAGETGFEIGEGNYIEEEGE